jgi:hypothetical protein
MPEIKSVSAWENEVKSCGATLGVNVSKSQVQKMARRFQKIDAATPLTAAEMFEMFKHYVYGDPTGEQAVRHIMNPDECTHGAARRLAVAA